MHRRRLIHGALAAAAGALLPDPLRPHFGGALAAAGKTLVVVFQRGGCDGLNMVVPFGDDDYYALRPSIAIAPPSHTNADSAVDLDGFFGLHPSLASLTPMYDMGDLAVLPAVSHDGASRSHFVSQRAIESGSASLEMDGWLNRYLSSTPERGPMHGVDLDPFMAHAMRGPARVSSLASLFELSELAGPDHGSQLMSDLAGIYAQPGDQSRPYTDRLHALGRTLLEDYEAFRGLSHEYVPDNDAVYPDSELALALQRVAQLVKAGVGLEVAALSIGGWDTHALQGGGEPGGRQSMALTRLGQALAAFHKDLGALMHDVLIVTMTEFGRSAAENASWGTDHGHAGTWMVLGGGVNGGLHLGPQGWPGLAQAQLAEGRYLAHTVDYRDIMAEVLARFLGVGNPSLLLDDHPYSPIGFLPA